MNKVADSYAGKSPGGLSLGFAFNASTNNNKHSFKAILEAGSTRSCAVRIQSMHRLVLVGAGLEHAVGKMTIMLKSRVIRSTMMISNVKIKFPRN